MGAVTPHPAELLRFQSSDPVADAALELAAITGVPAAEAEATVRRVLDVYHHGRPGDLRDIPPVIVRLVVHLTQPYRLPDMTARMGEVLKRIAQLGIRSIVDYGGGGGKDAILFARAGLRVTYVDLLDDLTPYVARRFALRGLDVTIADVRTLDDSRHEAISCMDVIEHVYDVERLLADLVARLSPGGWLFCYPAFYNSWDGDHVEKNCAYRPFFLDMMQALGLEYHAIAARRTNLAARLGRLLRIVDLPNPLLFRKPPSAAVAPLADERAALQARLYRYSARRSLLLSLWSWALLPFVWLAALVPVHLRLGRLAAFAAEAREAVFSNAIDALAVRRLSRRRLDELRMGGGMSAPRCAD